MSSLILTLKRTKYTFLIEEKKESCLYAMLSSIPVVYRIAYGYLLQYFNIHKRKKIEIKGVPHIMNFISSARELSTQSNGREALQ